MDDNATQSHHGRNRITMRPRWLIVLAIVVFAAVVVLFEYAVYVSPTSAYSWALRVFILAVSVAGFLIVFSAAFASVRRIEQELHRRNRELDALHRATLDISGEFSLDVILQRVVDQARWLLKAEFGAISVEEQPGRIARFITSGMREDLVEEIGEPPRGRGLLGVPLHEGARLRVRDVTVDSRSAGLPPHHPEVTSLLAVPIVCKSPFRGNLYLANKQSSPEFGPDDEEILVRFAAQAAIAIEYAHLHRSLRFLAVAEERARIAREMHDGMAQLLAYVNTKAQAALEHLKRNRVDAAGEQLDQLALAARNLYVDVREGILSLRTSADSSGSLDEAMTEFLQQWQEQTGIRVEAEFDGDLLLGGGVELQLLRILQEALANIRKHSGAEHAQLQIRRDQEHIIAVVKDDGKGFDPAVQQQGKGSRYGLAIMRERAESVGGEASVESVLGQGTTVRVRVPVDG